MVQKPELLKDILTKSLSGLGLLTKARRYQVFSMWTAIVGRIAANARPRYLMDDVLFVSTSSSTWAHELSLLKRKIMSSINKVLGGKYISDIQFSEHLWDSISLRQKTRVGKIPQPQDQEGPLANESGPASEKEGPEWDKNEVTYLRGLSSEIKDQDLQRTFARLVDTFETRKKVLLQRGYQVCHKCGYVYPRDKKLCPQCKYREDYRALKKIEAVLTKNPEMSDLAASLATGIEDVGIFGRVRDQIEDRWLMNIRRNLYFCERQPKLKHETAELVKLFLSSKKNTKVQDINWTDLEKEVGAHLAKEIRGALGNERKPLERSRR